MHETKRTLFSRELVQVVKRVANTGHDVVNDRARQWTGLGGVNHLPQVHPLHELENHVARARIDVRLQQTHDVRMIEVPMKLRFLGESFGVFGMMQTAFQQRLDCEAHRAALRRGIGIRCRGDSSRDPDIGHPSRTVMRHDFVRAESRSNRQGCCFFLDRQCAPPRGIAPPPRWNARSILMADTPATRSPQISNAIAFPPLRGRSVPVERCARVNP
jgi:hypothetical protein